MGKRANEQTGKRANWQTSKRANEQTSEWLEYKTVSWVAVFETMEVRVATFIRLDAQTQTHIDIPGYYCIKRTQFMGVTVVEEGRGGVEPCELL
jgi:hypothetical protein